MTIELNSLCIAAVGALEKVLEERPDKIQEELNEAARCLVSTRDALIRQQRQGAAVQPQLNRVNAILSLVFSAEYPLVGIRYQRIEKARDELIKLGGG